MSIYKFEQQPVEEKFDFTVPKEQQQQQRKRMSSVLTDPLKAKTKMDTVIKRKNKRREKETITI